jgi:hypothetical protein
MSSVRLAWLALFFLLSVPRADSASPPARAWPLDEAARRRLDQVALRQPLEGPAEEKVNVAGAFPAWLLSRLDLPVGEEVRRSRLAHAELVQRQPARLGPAAALRVLDRLVRQLPAYQRPAGLRFSLTLLEGDTAAGTPGGGFLVLPADLVDLLGPGGDRAEAALAFLLAREMAHVTLGHCRRGWQLLTLEDEMRKGLLKLDPGSWRDALETKVQTTGDAVHFLYSRSQEYKADLFALHLCRNAGFPLDGALDGLRLLAALTHPGAAGGDGPPPGPAGKERVCRYYRSLAADPLVRLKRLLMERDGAVEPGDEFGLFAYDRAGRTLVRCRPGGVGRGERPIVFLHGMHGSKTSFAAYLEHFSQEKALAGRPLLVFRHPGNGSLARSALFLSRQVRGVIAEPARTTFICHSAGGLVFRFYAEKLGGAFDRAVILATPHAGSDLTRLKYLADVQEFLGFSLRFGLTEGIARTLAEGRGEIGLDLHPDSLFLRYLGHDRRLAGRYHVFYGEWLRPVQALALQGTFEALRKQLRQRLALAPLAEGLLRHEAERLVASLVLPPEVLRGDVIVSAASARLPGAARTTRLRLRHLAFRWDPEAIRLVLESVVAR